MKRTPALLLLILLAGCHFFHKPTSPYKGYSTNDGITHFKFCDLETGRKMASEGAVIEAVLNYSKMNDSVFWSTHDKGYPYSVFLNYIELAHGSTYERQLLHAAEGDSITFIVPADSVFKDIFKLPLPFFLNKGDMMKVSARVTAIMDSAHYIARLKAIKNYIKDMDLQEQVVLAHFISSNSIPDSDKYENVYVIPILHGNGPQVQQGSMLSLAYRGTFLNGLSFDSVSTNNPLQFRYGDTAQMITGLERAIKKMREGEKAKIIIPSQLAFGENGSSTGIVPPYTTVVYEVTMIKVINGPVTKN